MRLNWGMRGQVKDEIVWWKSCDFGGGNGWEDGGLV